MADLENEGYLFEQGYKEAIETAYRSNCRHSHSSLQPGYLSSKNCDKCSYRFLCYTEKWKGKLRVLTGSKIGTISSL